MARPFRIIAKNTHEMPRSEWLELRRAYKGQPLIGGSDAAAICGENPWRSRLSVFLSKVGQAPEQQATERMEMGNVLEDPIADLFAKKTGFRVKRSNAVLQSIEWPWAAANVDRFVWDTDEPAAGILEIKNVGEYSAKDWEDGPPSYYLLQGQHYLAVTGAQYVWFAPLIGGNRLQPVKVMRDERLIKNLMKIESEFCELIKSRTPPAIDDSEDASKVLKYLYPVSTSANVVIPTDLYDHYTTAKQRLADNEREVRGYQNEIQALMGEAEGALIEGYPKPVFTWRGSTAKRLDVAALEAAEPELVQRYYKDTPMRRFLVKKTGE